MNKKGTGSKKTINLEIYRNDAKRLFAGKTISVIHKGKGYILIPPVKGGKNDTIYN